MTQKRVLGVDPGSRMTGYGIVEEEGGTIQALAYGTIQIFSEKSFPDRLKKLYHELEILIQKYKPTECAMETVFFAKNARSTIKLSQARGAAVTVVANHGLKLSEYSPTQIKQAVAGYGRADKEQVQKMLSLLLGSKNFITFDASDALAVAICHLNSIKWGEVQKKYDRATQR